MCVGQIKEWLETQREAKKATSVAETATPEKPQNSQNPFSKYAGMQLQEVIIRLGRGLSSEEIEQAKAAGVIVRETPKPEGERPDESGFVLRRDSGPRVNVLEPGRTYAYDFVTNGPCELAWSSKGAGGWIETWVNRDGEQLRGTYDKVIFGPAGQTYFTGLGAFRYCIRHSHSQPVTLGVQIL